MTRKVAVILVLASVSLTGISFVSGFLYERQHASKDTLDLDPFLISLLARPSDFEAINGNWTRKYYAQFFDNPTEQHEYAKAINDFSVGLLDQQITVRHEVSRFVSGKMPETTSLDEAYFVQQAVPPMEEAHLPNIKGLDSNSKAFCSILTGDTYITCFVESKYDEIYSVLSISSDNSTEAEMTNFMMPAMEKFYERLAKDPLNNKERR